MERWRAEASYWDLCQDEVKTSERKKISVVNQVKLMIAMTSKALIMILLQGVAGQAP